MFVICIGLGCCALAAAVIERLFAATAPTIAEVDTRASITEGEMLKQLMEEVHEMQDIMSRRRHTAVEPRSTADRSTASSEDYQGQGSAFSFSAASPGVAVGTSATSP